MNHTLFSVKIWGEKKFQSIKAVGKIETSMQNICLVHASSKILVFSV